MALTLRTRSDYKSDEKRFSAKITFEPIPELDRRVDYALVLSDSSTPITQTDFIGYAAVIAVEGAEGPAASLNAPLVHVPAVDHLKPGYIVSIEPRTGMVITIFRPDSRHNVIFTTERCNSNCLMCSQPPKDIDDSWRIQEHMRVLSLIDTAPEFLCITGGEPTLLGDGLLQVLNEIKDRLPGTSVQMLTNGRTYKDASFTAKVAAVQHPQLISAIPLYADVASIHDYIVQAEGAFDETVEGIYNAAEAGLLIEIRIVLHKQSIPRLRQLAEFIYRNFPFAAHVAFMGMEHMGYVKKNWDTLWVDPVDYMGTLRDAVEYLWQRRMNVSIYNLQLCVLPKDLWQLGRKSISDFKNEYVAECDGCTQRDHCAGLFASQVGRYSKHLKRL